jgi:hypothetical protein
VATVGASRRVRDGMVCEHGERGGCEP